MDTFRYDDSTIQVNTDAPSPIPEVARWLRKSDLSPHKVGLWGAVLTDFAGYLQHECAELACVLPTLGELCLAYCEDISITLFASVTGSVTVSASASATISESTTAGE